MNNTQSPKTVLNDATETVKELLRLFDERLLELHATASLKRQVLESGTSPIRIGPMVHVDFPAGPLQATAIYHTVEDRFTQLIARAADEAHFERPSFTISLLL
jgi:hypothetical protein